MAILLVLVGYKDTWIMSSNEESGDGYSDILVRREDEEFGIVIEVKYGITCCKKRCRIITTEH